MHKYCACICVYICSGILVGVWNYIFVNEQTILDVTVHEVNSYIPGYSES